AECPTEIPNKLIEESSQSALRGERPRVCCSSVHTKGDAHDQQASSCFRVGLTRLVNEQDIRTPQHVKNRARNEPGILATDIKSVSCCVSSVRVMCLENRIRN